MTGKLRAVVVDDEHLNREGLKLKLRQRDVIVVGEADSGPSGQELILSLAEARGVDVVFLDIRMDRDTAGLDLGLALRALAQPPRLVFVTAHLEFLPEVWPCHPDYFLRKPVADAELDNALARVRLELGRSAPEPAPTGRLQRLACRHIEATPGGERVWITTYIAPREVVYIRTGAVSGTVDVHLAGNRRLEHVRQLLRDLEARLAPEGFLLIHRSFLVNLARVQSLKPGLGPDSHRIVLRDDGIELPVARDRWEALLAALDGRA